MHGCAPRALRVAPAHVLGDYPEWLDAQLAATFSDERAEEASGARVACAARSARQHAEGDARGRAGRRSTSCAPQPTRWSPAGLRIIVSPDAKSPAIHAEPAFLKGQIEIQDEGSQLAALLSGAKPGGQVIDLCAGAGGKTLALAAAMENHGQIHATDTDKRRLAPIHERLERSGARNVQVITPRGEKDMLAHLNRRPTSC